MNTELAITADLITELHQHGQRTIESVLVLTPEGWYVRSNIDNPYPVALRADELAEAWLSDDEELDGDLAVTIADGFTEMTIPSELGDLRSPVGDALVVHPGGPLGSDDDFIDAPWAGAWWFDPASARQVLHAISSDPAREETVELWRTEHGRYLLHVETSYLGRHDWWYEITEDDAAQRLYDAEDDQVASTDGLLERAVRLAHDLASDVATTVPEVRRLGDIEGTVLYRTDVEAASGVFAVAGILSDLVRTRLLSDLRTSRGRAAGAVLADQGHNRAATHRVLAARRAVSLRTVSDLLDN